MTASAAPALWLDWCAVTGTDPASRDAVVLSRFAAQAGAPHRVLRRLRAGQTRPVAPSWPAALRDPPALHRLLERGTVLAGRGDTGWITRLRLYRLMFAAVLLAPPGQGGLGFTRRAALDLTPATLRAARPRVGTTASASSCPRCTVWSWLHILGTHTGWTHRSVRMLLHEPERLSGGGVGHLHARPDPSPDWTTSPALLPGLDRWGHLDLYASLHPASLSALIPGMTDLASAPEAAPSEPPEPRPVRHFSAAEEQAVLDRADAVNARIAALLKDDHASVLGGSGHT
ncbi:hypothetical protein [Granulicoccus phenolivorans]|uniref:hypothetical protein n=1 Tax=Granulicoccus phenolivorans TaxID=266854 RepID=UPI00047BDF01|nr:hypothetical protein [Granulicoccus phenolivorans]